MILSEEKKKKLAEAGLKFPEVDGNCIGCNACVAISSDAFVMNDETGKSEVLERDNYEDIGVEDSIMACPVDSISWKES